MFGGLFGLFAKDPLMVQAEANRRRQARRLANVDATPMEYSEWYKWVTGPQRTMKDYIAERDKRMEERRAARIAASRAIDPR